MMAIRFLSRTKSPIVPCGRASPVKKMTEDIGQALEDGGRCAVHDRRRAEQPSAAVQAPSGARSASWTRNRPSCPFVFLGIYGRGW